MAGYPSVCTKEPVHRHAFCPDHCKIVEEQNVPTRLREFLKYAGVIEKGMYRFMKFHIDDKIDNFWYSMLCHVFNANILSFMYTKHVSFRFILWHNRLIKASSGKLGNF